MSFWPKEFLELFIGTAQFFLWLIECVICIALIGLIGRISFKLWNRVSDRRPPTEGK